MNSYTLIGFSVIWAIIILFGLSWIFISSKGLWYIKALATAFAFVLIFSTILVWRQIQGTPKNIQEIEGLIIRAYLVREPTKTDKGNIWLWVIEPERKVLEPVNISVPYSRELHEELSKNEGLRKGRPQQVKKDRGDGTSNDSSNQIRLHDFTSRNMTK